MTMTEFPKRLAQMAALVAGLLLMPLASADEPSQAVSQRILDSLSQARPELEYSEVMASPIAGLYEVRVSGGPSLYVTENGKHFIAGDLFGIEPGGFVNIQEQKRAGERIALMATVDPADQIVFSPQGETKAYVNVFTDVDCGYCQKLHREIQAINDYGIEVRYLAYPRAGPGSVSANRLATAWCADDRNNTLTRLKSGESVPLNVCQGNPVTDQYTLGSRIGVNGTPNMVTEDGFMIGGYLPAKQLAQRLGVIPLEEPGSPE